MDGQDLKDCLEDICGLCQRESTQWLEEASSRESLRDPEGGCGKRSSQILPITLNLHGLPQKL